MEPIVFDSFERKEVPVLIKGKHYTLKEMSMETGIKVRNAQIQAAVVVDGKITGTKGYSHIDKVVLSECLFDDSGKNVPMNVIGEWSDQLCTKLVKTINQLSGVGLDEEVEQLEKQLTSARKTQKSLGN